MKNEWHYKRPASQLADANISEYARRNDKREETCNCKLVIFL